MIDLARPETVPNLGAHVRSEGISFAVYSAHATSIDLCLFDDDGAQTAAHPLPGCADGTWFGILPGAQAGQAYGYRAHGPYAPNEGHRFNANKLLLDPYATEIRGTFANDPVLCGYADAHTPDTRDSAPFVPKSVVTEAVVAPDTRPKHTMSETILYEAHVKGLSMTFPGVPDALRGTVEALGCDAMLAHLKRLGITAIELLPIQALLDDAFLLKRGLRNYWGYNTAAYFAPEPRYLGPGGASGLRATIQRLHAEGIEVILDVVYNHTCESDAFGPTVGLRGLDNASYYWLEADDPSAYVNDTGCGNTLNVAHPMVTRMIVDSLRHWVTAYNVDGFRFDLATTLVRDNDKIDMQGTFMSTLLGDPVLRDVKLIAEPWDIGPGGYQLGAFPAPFAEWNDRFRDDVRTFWRGDAGALPALATRLMGSADVFDGGVRAAWSSVNFVTAHDGFTLADLVSYTEKHNAANGEHNRDGHSENLSDNMGLEGPSDDPVLIRARARRRLNMLATLILPQGTPMLLAGDEAGNTQQGNNNAYCQDNAIGWVDWAGMDDGFVDAVAMLIAVRRRHPALRAAQFLHDDANVMWLPFDGEALDWHAQDCRRVAVRLRLDGDDVILAVNGTTFEGALTLPDQGWQVAVDTANPDRGGAPCDTSIRLAPESVVVLEQGGADVG